MSYFGRGVLIPAYDFGAFRLSGSEIKSPCFDERAAEFEVKWTLGSESSLLGDPRDPLSVTCDQIPLLVQWEHGQHFSLMRPDDKFVGTRRCIFMSFGIRPVDSNLPIRYLSPQPRHN